MTSGFNKLRISLIGTLFLATIFPLAGHGGPIGGRTTAGVSGTVFNPLGAVVLNAEVLVRGSSFETQTATNEEGKYEIDELPSGAYSIEVRSAGFCRGHRASFNARPQIQLKFDFTLLVCPSHGQAPLTYESFTLNSGSQNPQPAFLVHLGKRADRQETIEFEGAHTQFDYYDSDAKVTDRRQVYVNPTVTYDRWTISASHLTLNKRTLRLAVTGDVVILDGVKEIKGKRAEVDFALPKPILNVTE